MFFYTEVFSNRHKRHSVVGYISPNDNEQSFLSNSGLI